MLSGALSELLARVAEGGESVFVLPGRENCFEPSAQFAIDGFTEKVKEGLFFFFFLFFWVVVGGGRGMEVGIKLYLFKLLTESHSSTLMITKLQSSTLTP